MERDIVLTGLKIQQKTSILRKITYIGLMQFLSKSQQGFWEHRQVHSKIYMEGQRN